MNGVAPRTALDALDRVRVAVLVFDERKREIHRNAAARELLDNRHSGVLARAALQELVDALPAGGEPLERTLDLYGPPPRHLILRAEMLEDGGVVGVIEDATAVSQLEAVRRDFVANVSHELRTPVSAVLLLAELLSGEEDAAVVERLVGRLIEEADRVARIVDGLLDLSRLEAGSIEPPKPLKVAHVVNAALQGVAELSDQAGVKVSAVPVDDALVVRGDQAQLTTALSNLLDNAVKYSDAGTVVEVEAHAQAETNEVVISVRDHGPGIPSADIDRVFERFYRVDRARSRNTGGTGLGLAIVRHVAVNHGGTVTVESVEGEGAVFTLRLPASS